MVFDQVAEIIAKLFKVDKNSIKPETKLVEELKADSANKMLMVMELEDAFDMTVDDAAIVTIHTVGDIVNYIESKQ